MGVMCTIEVGAGLLQNEGTGATSVFVSVLDLYWIKHFRDLL